jgi:Mrp family chromosome partitioning ATPase
MEPIERALAKARRDPRRPFVATSSGFPPRQPVAPVYALTRVAPADPSVMEREHIIAGRADNPDAGLYRALRAQVLHWLAKTGKRSLAVVSASDNEGRSMTAANLAVALSMDVNQTVLLVDADLRNPGVHKKFGIEPTVGLDDVLQGNASVEKCLVNPGIERLVLLPARRSLTNGAELLASPQMAQIATEMRNRYRDRVVVYDAPSLLGHGDAIGFLPYAESALLVVREGAVSPDEMARVKELLKDCSVIGAVLNGVV